MDAVDCHREVVAARELRSSGVLYLEAYSVRESFRLGVGSRFGNRLLVKVEAVHPHLWICLCDGDARPSYAAPHVGHPGGRVGLQTSVNVGDGRKPLASHEVSELGPVPRLELSGLPPYSEYGTPPPVLNASST